MLAYLIFKSQNRSFMQKKAILKRLRFFRNRTTGENAIIYWRLQQYCGETAFCNTLWALRDVDGLVLITEDVPITPFTCNMLAAGDGIVAGAKVVNTVGDAGTNQPKVIRCYNCKGEGHTAKQFVAKKRVKDSKWFKDKMLLAQAQEAKVVLNDEHQDSITDSLKENDEWTNQPRVIRCYNCKGEGHTAKQFVAKKRVKDSKWFKDKMLLAQAQEAKVILNDEHQDSITDSLKENDECEDLQLQATINFKAYH
nr:fructokinase-like 2, chloroplastic [Tanacetum cinerariifolium]